MTGTCLYLSNSWWLFYEQDCKKISILKKNGLKFDHLEEFAKHKLRTAIQLSHEGMDVCNKTINSISYNKKELTPLLSYQLSHENNFLYYNAVYLHYFDNSSVEKSKICIRAHKFFNMIIKFYIDHKEEEELKYRTSPQPWYNKWESAAYCLAKIGDNIDENIGKQELIGLIQNSIQESLLPRPPYEWREALWKEHNSKLHLGISKPIKPIT